jgi:competence protein ComEA
MKTAWAIAFGVAAGLLAAGLLLLVARAPSGQAVQLLPPPTVPPLTVDVTGAVARPGVYALPPGSRVQDAIQAAGGLRPEADQELLNLAALLKDGQVVRAPRKSAAATGMAVLATTPGGLVNINTASLQELDTLPGIGPVLAQRILDYRAANGPFGTVEDLQQLEGLGPGIFEKIKDLVTVEDQ